MLRSRSNPQAAGLVAVAALLTVLSAGQANAQSVEVYTDSTAQTIRGFGAAFIEFWQPDLTADQVQNAFGMGDGELGLSILRLGINPNPSQWSENLEAAQKAVELGAIVFASPWNAPSNLLKAKINPNDPDTVDVAKFDQYAQHLSDFNTYMASNGVDLYAISIQNEPDYGHDWTGWSSENMVKFLAENAPSIGAARVIAPESFQFRRDYTDPIFSDSAATANTDIIGGHIYGGGNADYPLARENGKDVWMTEYLLNLNTGGGSKAWDEYTDDERWAETLEMLRTIHTSMKGNMNAYVWWYLKRYYGILGDGLFRESNGVPTQRGYAFSHFSRFVRPGYVRLETDGPFGRGFTLIYVTAYQNPQTNDIVIVAVNDETADKEIPISVSHLKSALFKRYLSTANQAVVELDEVAVTDSSFTVTLPKQSVTTFVSNQIDLASEGPADDTPGYRLDQNYPNPFGGVTKIGYVLPRSGDVRITIHDVLGREVAVLEDAVRNPGYHEVSWDATTLPSGVYLYTLSAGAYSDSRTMIVVN